MEKDFERKLPLLFLVCVCDMKEDVLETIYKKIYRTRKREEDLWPFWFYKKNNILTTKILQLLQLTTLYYPRDICQKKPKI